LRRKLLEDLPWIFLLSQMLVLGLLTFRNKVCILSKYM
jgi:hypothetical protein